MDSKIACIVLNDNDSRTTENYIKFAQIRQHFQVVLIPVKKKKRGERLQGQLGYDQPGQQELRGPCRRRKVWRKETKQTTNNRNFEI